MPNANAKTPDELIAELMASGVDGDTIARKVRKVRLKATRDHFGQRLMDDVTNAPAVTLKVKSWAALREFMLTPVTAEHNPGGPMFEDIARDGFDAIDDKDEERLLMNALLVLKAIRRG